jgi:thiol-disulfide isomerase/thioredoxin
VKRQGRIAAVVLTGVLALAGCAGIGAGGTSPEPDTGAESPTPAASQTAIPEPSPETMTSESPAAPVEGAYLDYSDGVIEQTAGSKVLFFHAPWCPQCRKLDEQLRADGAPDGITVFKVDYDSRSDLRQRYGVTLQTTVVFVDDAGDLISSTVLYDDPSIESLVAAAP